MTDLTQLVTLTTDWTSLAAASSYGSFGYQLASNAPVALYIGTTAPDANTTNFIVLSAKGDRSFSEEIPSTYTLYAKALRSTGASLRGFRAA